MSQRALMATGANTLTYVDDVFSAYTYTGTGASNPIINGVDLSGKGGLVWTKSRGAIGNHYLIDSARGIGQSLSSDTTGAQSATTFISSLNSNGYTLSSASGANGSGATFASWTFRKAAKFFDVVTWTGDNTTRNITHSLGATPGMIVVKRTDTSSTQGWVVWHTSTGGTNNLLLNGTAAAAALVNGRISAASSTDFTVTSGSTNNADVNATGGTYVAYLFAHDTASDGLIQCGSFTTDAGGNATVTLGWEPQFLLVKNTNAVEDWYIFDTARNWSLGSSAGTPTLSTDISSAEYSSAPGAGNPTATGFQFKYSASKPYIYLAIRRPNKPPTTGTQVYNAVARTGTGAAATVTGVGFAPDLVLGKKRASISTSWFIDRLRGRVVLDSTATSAEATPPATTNDLTSFDMDGFSLGTASATNLNISPNTEIYWNLKRSPGVFTMSCYTGTGANKTEAHDLGVAPEFWLVKGRSGATQWVCGSSLLANTEKIVMPTPAGKVTDATAWNSTYPTSTNFSLGTASAVNTSSATYVCYMWATKVGISKVFAYTGNGTSINVDCGFSSGARFVMIVRTSAAGSFYVWDSTRGIVASNDPYLALDTTAAEVTTDDSIDPLSSGFTVNQVAASNVNVNGATYIGIAYA